MDCSQRWTELDTPDAWTNTLATWNKTYKNNVTTINGFTLAVMQILHGPEEMDCEALAQLDGSCSRTYDCTDIRGTDAEGNGGGSGPAAYLILNSFVILNKVSFGLPTPRYYMIGKSEGGEGRERGRSSALPA